jgi:hypothetical protein
VATGQIHVAAVILDCPWEAESMAVADLLTSQRRWGESRCRKFLAQIPMSETKTVGSMTERQRRTLAARLSPTMALPEPDAIAAQHRREAAAQHAFAAPRNGALALSR